MPSLMWSAVTRSPRRSSSGTTIGATGGRPVQVEFEFDALIEQVGEDLERESSVDRVQELLVVVVVADRDAVAGCDGCCRVECIGRLRDLLDALPAVGCDERIEDPRHAELARSGEDLVGRRHDDRGVERILRARRERRVTGGSRYPGARERGCQLVSARDEAERLDAREADRTQSCERAVEVFGQLVSHGPELDGDRGGRHCCSCFLRSGRLSSRA